MDMPKVGEVVTIKRLRSIYGSYAETELSEYVKPVDQPYKKHQVRKYEVVSELPAVAEYRLMVNNKYTQDVPNAISDACSELEKVRDELQDWYYKMPHSFFYAEKGNRLYEAIKVLENIEEPNVPDEAEKVNVYVPPMRGHDISRRDRIGWAAGVLMDCAEALRSACETNEDDENADYEVLANELESLASEAKECDPPGMY